MTATPTEDGENAQQQQQQQQLFAASTGEDIRLEDLGYEQGMCVLLFAIDASGI